LPVVGVALLSNGIFEVFFYYREHKASLIRIQHEQAEAAAAKIGQFIKEIEKPVGLDHPTALVAGSMQDRRSMRCVVAAGAGDHRTVARSIRAARKRLRVSRLAMDAFGLRPDLSKDPKFTEAVANKVYYGPGLFSAANPSPT